MNAARGRPRPRGPVLIVEDDAGLLETIADVLDMAGYDVECASNGQEALDLLRQGIRPCLIILDLMMPVMDGREFRRQQWGDATPRDIPVIVICSPWPTVPQSEIPEADDYLVKPFRIDALLTAVNRLCLEVDSQAARTP